MFEASVRQLDRLERSATALDRALMSGEPLTLNSLLAISERLLALTQQILVIEQVVKDSVESIEPIELVTYVDPTESVEPGLL